MVGKATIIDETTVFQGVGQGNFGSKPYSLLIVMKNLKKSPLVYWTSTGLISLLMGISAVSYLLRVPHFVDATRELGYPLYFMAILGTAKVLGVAALLW